MTTFVALDVSLEKTAICVMQADGSVVAEVTAGADPARLLAGAAASPHASHGRRRVTPSSSTSSPEPASGIDTRRACVDAP